MKTRTCPFLPPRACTPEQPDMAAFPLLQDRTPYTLADVVGALVSLTGLAELHIGFFKPAVPRRPGAAQGVASAALLRHVRLCS